MSVANYGLTTVARLKQFLDISASDADTTAVLEHLINTCTDWVEGYCQRRFLRTVYTDEKYDGNDSQSLMFRNYPVDMSQTFTLQQRTSALDEDEWETIDSEYYFKYPNAGYVEFPKKKYGDVGRLFVVGNQNYRISYTAGYYVPQDAGYVEGASTALPMDLEYAVWKLCAVAWNSRRGSSNVTAERLGSYSVTFAKEAFEDETITDVLNKYMRQDTVTWR